ncbi:hypothetical protein CRG98_039450 [Punica granatum]|uniref:Uncharacterized protein n=1 Tax=Punica granatum TaxID=22663 RepID=A0A2I0I914_PUNGR|nr:hypothetical protein CRG98_039450 [Punica granatum]
MEPQPRPPPTPLSPRTHQLTDFTQPDWKHDVLLASGERIRERNQSGKFGKGFNRSQAKDQTEKEAWRAALREAGTISSWHVDNDARDEAEFIGLVVEDLSNRVFYFRSPYFTNNAVGLDHNVDHLISMLNIGSDDVRMVGIYGTEGIGKTAIAKTICSRLYNKFEGVSLLKDIRHADQEHKLVNLQRQLLQDILKIKQVMLSDRKKHNMREIRIRLSQKKLLLVLDNLDKKEQPYFFTGERDFLGPGSRILITTRDEQLLDDLGVHEKNGKLAVRERSKQRFTEEKDEG